ncbi:substrate-binding domain-containing protein [Pseudanabaenaceae cyanobacterium LEGE 13415]|nr:substrate-binding domain-containing protein [Pseudanabaenaceae cyanobacterium LEGE 13415]
MAQLKTDPIKIPPIVFILFGLAVCSGAYQVFKPSSTATSVTVPGLTSLVGEKMSDVQAVPKGEFRYGGSTSWAVVRKNVDIGMRFSFPDFRLKYVDPEGTTPNSQTGLAMLLDGKLDFVQSSQGIPESIQQQAKQRGIKLKEISIATDSVAVYVHPQLNLPGLTWTQFQAILAGEIRNWQELGGPNQAIQIYQKSRQEVPNAPFTAIASTTESIRRVANDPGGISWASATLVVPQCGIKVLPLGTSPNQWISPYQSPEVPPAECTSQKHNQVNPEIFRNSNYPWQRSLSIVVIEDGSDRQKAGEAYARMLMTQQGQDLLQESGYAPTR